MSRSSDRVRRSRWVLPVLPVAALSAMALATATTAAAATAAPPGRAYEMVSPVDKAGSDVSWGSMQATPSGDALAFGATASYAGSPTSLLGGINLATRGADWTSKSLDAPQGSAAGLLISSVAFNSPDLGTSMVQSSAALAPGATEGDGNVYVRDNRSGTYSFMGGSPDPLFNQLFLFLGSPVAGTSTDMKHIVFDVSQGKLTADSVDGAPNAYEFADGRLRLVGVLPDGTVNPTGARTKVTAHDAHVVSDDGRRVYFTINFFGESPLYLREDGERTIPISASRVPGDAGTMYPATFGGATADGDVAYFSSMNELTPESSTHSSATLYRYQRSTDTLTDLLPDAGPTGANVYAIIQVSADGRYVWFTSATALAPGGTDGDTNLYVWHDGTVRFESTLGSMETYGPTTWNMSPDGHLLAFSTDGHVPGYDNTSAACTTTGACAEVQLADASTPERARCISCPSPGVTARGDARIADTTSTLGNYWPRSVLADGRVFFNSPERLVPEDTNGKIDVYMWSGDRVSLISTGRSEDDSTFGDASADGRDVFFRTTERLVGQDADRNIDVYDARLGGGIASQDVVTETRPCAGDACRPRPSDPPAVAQPPSTTFQGPGDPPAPAASSSTPRFTIKALTRTQKRGLAKTGKVTLSVKVTRAGRVSATARATVRGHVATVARGSATATRARTLSVKLALSRATRKALAQRKHPVLTLHVAYSPMRETKTIKVTL